MKLSLEQSMAVINQLLLHKGMNNADAEACYRRWANHDGNHVESTIALVEAGDPYLTQIVMETIEGKLK